ncbi:MAG: alpha/beta hydrolase fold domain-containing protein [Bifidobacterium breve]|nr:alpha/beta hydrolase fold domain-containing protein [Bifidobacterium breve]
MATPSRLCRQPLPAGAIFLRTRETFPPAGAICLTPLPIPTASCCLATARAAILRPPSRSWPATAASSCRALTNPYFAPLTAHDLSNQPRTLVLSAEYCPLRDEDEAYARRLQLVNDNVSCYRIHDGIHGYLLNTSAVGLVATTYRIIEHFLDDTPLEPAPGTGTTANAPEGGDAWQDVLGTD